MTYQVYVHNEIEVKMTGRSAVKKLPSGRNWTIYEITPVDPFHGDWKKWVRKEDLFEIQQ